MAIERQITKFIQSAEAHTAALNAHTAALKENTAAFLGQGTAPVPVTPEAPKSESEKTEPAPQPAGEKPAKEPEPEKADKTAGVDKKAVAERVIEVIKKHSREQALAVLAEFGVQKVPDLDPEHYAAVVEKLDAILEG